MFLGCPVVIVRATVTGHSLPGVHHLRDGPMPSTGDGAQVGALDPPLCSPMVSGDRGSQTSPKRGEKYPAESTGAISIAFLPIGSGLLGSAVHGVAFPCLVPSLPDGMEGLREPGWVPSAEPGLGCTPRYVDGRVFVIEVLPESQAEVDEVVLAGDILNEINGCSLRNAYSGQAGAVLQKLKGQPLSFHLLRWQWHNGEVYEPLLPYLKILKEKEPHFQLQHNPRHRAEGEPRRLQGAGCSTTCDTWDG
ncbi:uncharacterized protein LOC115599324 isoform X1 [Calypte anna]|uniref:uncharacterized protein LOC115599324 isoform X1 n=1 Tax=Calypte anna TaxID=9244 RepID=UPI0011C37943|nr:uncharacterized protein LOC115599324 isoform X1 [Calypte anna]